MQIAIEIPHNLYESVIKGYALSDLGNSELYKAVQHGTPLPEHPIIPAEEVDDDDDECIVTDEVVNILCRDCKHHSEDGCYVCYYEPATKEGEE